MLNKVKLGAALAAIIMVVRLFAPNVEIPEGMQDSIMLVIVFIAQFFIPETDRTIDKLTLK